MIVDQIINKGQGMIQSAGLKSVGAASIEFNAMTAKLLSGIIYSDFKPSMIRELITNSLDAQARIGVDRPLIVKVPTQLDTGFYIQDNGCGLSLEEVNKYLVGYFSSSKRDTNSETGFMGVGFKSVFFQNDQVVIVSAHQGKESTYMLVKDENGIPVPYQIGESKPVSKDWPHGLRVAFSVPMNEVESYEKAIAKTCFFLKKKVHLVGSNLQLSYVELNDKGEGRIPERIAEKYYASSFYRSRSYVVMGNIGYPLESSRIEGLTSDERIFISEPNFVFEVPLGSIGPSMSREELEYDNKATQRTIAEYAKRKHQEFMAAIAKTFVIDVSLEDCMKVYIEAPNELKRSVIRAARDSKFACRSDFLMRVSDEFREMHVYLMDEGLTSKSLEADGIDALGMNVSSLEFAKSHKWNQIKAIKSAENGQRDSVTVTKVTRFNYLSGENYLLIVDACTYKTKRTREYLDDAFRLNNRAFMFVVQGDNVTEKTPSVQKLVKAFGIKHIVKVSDLPKPLINRTAREKISRDGFVSTLNPRCDATRYSLNGNDYHAPPYFADYKAEDLFEEDELYYIPINKISKTIVAEGAAEKLHEKELTEFLQKMAALQKLGMFPEVDISKVVVLGRTEYAAVKKMGDVSWINLVEMVNDAITENAKIIQSMSNTYLRGSVDLAGPHMRSFLVDIISKNGLDRYLGTDFHGAPTREVHQQLQLVYLLKKLGQKAANEIWTLNGTSLTEEKSKAYWAQKLLNSKPSKKFNTSLDSWVQRKYPAKVALYEFFTLTLGMSDWTFRVRFGNGKGFNFLMNLSGL